MNPHGELLEFMNLDIPKIADNGFCSLLLYGSAEFPCIINYMILESTIKYIKTAFTRCRHILKTMKNVTVAKFELAFTRCRNNLKTVGNLPVKSSLQDFDAKEVYLNP